MAAILSTSLGRQTGDHKISPRRVREENFVVTQQAVNVLVTHQWPDTDAWLCVWIARKWMTGASTAKLEFVRSGERLPGSDGDSTVVHLDTGGGIYDQHGKRLVRGCSAQLLAQDLKVSEDPGLQPLVELAIAADNADPLPFTSLHHLIGGYPAQCRKVETDGRMGPDWEAVERRVSEAFEIVYYKATQQWRSRMDLDRFARWAVVPNGIKVAVLLGQPKLSGAAFEAGADVVVWTQPLGRTFYAGVQLNNVSDVTLGTVAGRLREAESVKRRVSQPDRDKLRVLGQGGPTGAWFLHDSLRLVLCGSQTHPLTPEERTVLNPTEIVQYVCDGLSEFPFRKDWKTRRTTGD